MKACDLIKRLQVFDPNFEVVINSNYASEGVIEDVTSDKKEIILISDIYTG